MFLVLSLVMVVVLQLNRTTVSFDSVNALVHGDATDEEVIVSRLRELHQQDSNIVREFKSSNDNLLHIYAQKNMQRVVGFLLDECKFDINAKLQDGNTALHLAARADYSLASFPSNSVVELLLEKKANRLLLNDYDETYEQLMECRPKTRETHGQHLNTLQQGSRRTKFLLVGDSMFERLKSSAWLEELEEKGCFVAGVGGDRVKDMWWRLQQDQKLLQSCGSNLVGMVLLAGTNNIEGQDAKQIAQDVLMLVKMIRKHRPIPFKIAVLGLLPRDPWRQIVHDRVEAVNAALMSGISALDEYIIYQDCNQWQQLKGLDGFKNPHFFSDEVHLNNEGNRILSTVIIQLLAAMNALA